VILIQIISAGDFDIILKSHYVPNDLRLGFKSK